MDISKQGILIRDLRGNISRKDYVKDLGITAHSLYRIETAKNGASMEVLESIAKKHNLPVTYFFEENNYVQKNLLGKQISLAREKLHLNEKELADSLGMTKTMIFDVEQGKPIPGNELKILCRYLKIEIPETEPPIIPDEIPDDVKRFISNPDNLELLRLAMYIKDCEVPVSKVRSFIDSAK